MVLALMAACATEPGAGAETAAFGGDPVDAVDAVAPDAGAASPTGDTVVDALAEPDPGPSCAPSCGGKACGDDGCGGTCGECGDGTSCLAFACLPDAPPCPAEGTIGTEIGDKFLNLTLPDCDGAPVSFHDHCGADALLIFTYHGW